MLYIDTSAFVPLLVREGRSRAVYMALAGRSDAICISPWVITETHSAIALKCRVGALTQKQADAAHARIPPKAGGYQIAQILDADFASASDLIGGLRAPLRAADALHIAISLRLGAELMTLDKEMQAAALEAGLSLVTV